MRYCFAALRFTEDENICDRVYWYLSDFCVAENEEVLAPVGPNDRLQKARIERILFADERNAPYDIALIKSVTAGYGARKLAFGDITVHEFGGIRYDDRHYTRFGVITYADTMPEVSDIRTVYPSMSIFEVPMSEDDGIYRALIRGHGALLVGGEGKRICKILLDLLRDKGGEFFSYLGFGEREIAQLRRRLG